MRFASLLLGLGLSPLALALAAGTVRAQPTAAPTAPAPTAPAPTAPAPTAPAPTAPAPTAPAPAPSAPPGLDAPAQPPPDPAAAQPAPMIPIAPAPPAPLTSPAFMSIDPLARPTSLADDRSLPPFDWMAPAGASSLGVGAIFALSGAIVLGTQGGGQQCGRDGCVDRPDYLARNTGASLLGAGAGFALVGGVTLLTGFTVAPGPGDRRESQPMMVTGIGLTALSAAGLGLGIAEARTYDPGDVSFESAWPVLVGATVAAGVGIPLLVIGADIDSAEDREAERRAAAAPKTGQRHSVGMMVGGGILTGLGGLTGLVGTGLTIAALGEGGEFGGLFALVIGAPMIGGGGILTAIGVPLLCAGAKRDGAAPEAETSSAPPAWLVPEVELGPTGFSSTWRF